MPSLYEIEQRIDAKLEKSEDELTEEEKAELEADLIELAGEEEDKVDSSGFRLFKWKANADFYAAQEALFASKKKACLSKAERLKELYQDIMKAKGLKKISGKKYTISLQNSAPSLHVDDISKIPAEYFTVPDPVLSKSLALSHLKEGVVIPGCSIERKQHIRIR